MKKLINFSTDLVTDIEKWMSVNKVFSFTKAVQILIKRGIDYENK
jgi:hypothetical protein